jgi:hypothetical protein
VFPTSTLSAFTAVFGFVVVDEADFFAVGAAVCFEPPHAANAKVMTIAAQPAIR